MKKIKIISKKNNNSLWGKVLSNEIYSDLRSCARGGDVIVDEDLDLCDIFDLSDKLYDMGGKPLVD